MRALAATALSLALLVPAGALRAAPAVDWDAVRAKLEQEPLGTELEVSPGIFMTLHRNQAKSPLRGGWHRASSTNGNFAVELPATFNDYSMRANAKDGVEVQVDGIGTTTADGIAYSAVCMRRADGSLTPESKAITDKTESVGEPIRAWSRILLLGNRVCTLTVEAKGTVPLPKSSVVKRFLRSLKPTKKK